MSTAHNINIDTVGRIVLETGDILMPQEYVCSALQLSMRVNSIPTASVVVHVNDLQVGDTKRYNNNYISDPLDLLHDLQNYRKNGTMQKCRIFEVTEQYRTQIFDGYIASSALMYKTGTPTIRAVRFSCVGKAAALLTKPLSDYVTATGAKITTDSATANKFSRDAIIEQYNNFSRITNIAQAVVEKALETVTGKKGRSLATTISAVIDEILKTALFKNKEQQQKNQSGMLDCIYSDYEINTEQVGENSFSLFYSNLCNRQLQLMKNGSILESLQTILLSDAYMLNLVPRWEREDFKMEIAPSTAWVSPNPSTLRLSQNYVISIDSDQSYITTLNIPDLFVVSFADQWQIYRGDTQEELANLTGKYSPDPALMEAMSANPNPLQQKMLEDFTYKVKVYKAPSWQTPAFGRTKAAQKAAQTKPENQKEGVQVAKVQKEPSAAQSTEPNINKTDCVKVADMLAKELFIYLYGAQDKLQQTLVPSMRFGLSGATLEDNLGELIEFECAETAGGEDTAITCGVLEAIAYTYQAGAAGSCSYEIELSRVRPIPNDGETSTDQKSTIYVKRQDHKD